MHAYMAGSIGTPEINSSGVFEAAVEVGPAKVASPVVLNQDTIL